MFCISFITITINPNIILVDTDAALDQSLRTHSLTQIFTCLGVHNHIVQTEVRNEHKQINKLCYHTIL